MFQSRYRAASHFRLVQCLRGTTSSWQFQSRYRAASHFRFNCIRGRIQHIGCFNLVIERLLISGTLGLSNVFPVIGFNLVIERLLISGRHCTKVVQTPSLVSISLSSGFSFQVAGTVDAIGAILLRFNLVIERLLISGGGARATHDALHEFQSRYRAASHFRSIFQGGRGAERRVSISLSSGFSFQATQLLRQVPSLERCFNLVIERLLISGCKKAKRRPLSKFQSRYRAASHFRSVPAEPLIRFG